MEFAVHSRASGESFVGGWAEWLHSVMTVLSLASILSESLLPEYTAAESAAVIFFRVFSAVFPDFLQHVAQAPSESIQFPFDLKGFLRVADQVGPPVCGILTRMHDFFASMCQREFSYKHLLDCIGLVFSPMEEPKGVQSFEMLKCTPENDLQEFVFAVLPAAAGVEAQGLFPQSSISAFLSRFVTSFLVTATSSLLTPELQNQYGLCATLRTGFPHRRSMLSRFRDFALQVEVLRPVVPVSFEPGAARSLVEGVARTSVVGFPMRVGPQHKAKALELSGASTGSGGGCKRLSNEIQLKRSTCYEKHFKGKCTRADCTFGHPCPLRIGGNFCEQDHAFCIAHPQEFQRYQAESAERKRAKAGAAGE